MGRVVTIIYAIVGIPLTLLTLTNLGSFMATAFRFLYRNVCCGFCCLCCRKPDIPHVSSATVKYRDDENGDPGASKSLTGDQQDEVYCLEHQPSKPKTYSIRVYWRAGIRRLMQTEDNETVTVPIYISLLLIAGYIAIGALLFTLWEEDWDYLIGSYFCFYHFDDNRVRGLRPGYQSTVVGAAGEASLLCHVSAVWPRSHRHVLRSDAGRGQE